MTKFDSSGLRNIIKVQKEENDKVNSNAIPAIYVKGDSKSLRIVTSIDGIKDFFVDYTIVLGAFYNIRVDQEKIGDKTFFQVFINDNQIYKIENHHPENFGDVKVYQGSLSEVGTVLNLKIKKIACK